MKAVVCDICKQVPLLLKKAENPEAPHFYTVNIDCTQFNEITKKVVINFHMCDDCYKDYCKMTEGV